MGLVFREYHTRLERQHLQVKWWIIRIIVNTFQTSLIPLSYLTRIDLMEDDITRKREHIASTNVQEYATRGTVLGCRYPNLGRNVTTLVRLFHVQEIVVGVPSRYQILHPSPNKKRTVRQTLFESTGETGACFHSAHERSQCEDGLREIDNIFHFAFECGSNFNTAVGFFCVQ